LREVLVKDIDRLAPALRPARTAVMHQRWAELAFLHWPVPVAALRALVPSALTIDTFENTAYVGVVPFTVTGARPMLMPPLPWVSDFHEVNVRTYVHLDGGDPGVWFFSLDASNPLVVAAARALFLLPYHHARMEIDVDPGGIDFRSERADAEDAMLAARYEPLGQAQAAAPGSLEHFLAERYLLYTSSDRRLWQGQVHHEPYPLQKARAEVMVEGLVAAAGIARPEGQPPLVHFAREVQVEIFALRDVGPAGD
jgi:uncharacterized protein YqjF (DUF2071 family)